MTKAHPNAVTLPLRLLAGGLMPATTSSEASEPSTNHLAGGFTKPKPDPTEEEVNDIISKHVSRLYWRLVSDWEDLLRPLSSFLTFGAALRAFTGALLRVSNSKRRAYFDVVIGDKTFVGELCPNVEPTEEDVRTGAVALILWRSDSSPIQIETPLPAPQKK